MVASASGDSFEQMIGQWRTYVRRHPSIHPRDVDELESHLRDQAAALDPWSPRFQRLVADSASERAATSSSTERFSARA